MTAWADTPENAQAERAAWLEWRRGGIGGSDIAGILGLSRYSSPWSVWADKVGLRPQDTPSTDVTCPNAEETG